MDLLELIYSRRSIRKFTGVSLKDEELEKILQAGFSAPSAHNYQPWEFIVIRDDEKINFIAEHHPYAKMLPEAKTGILVCGNTERQKHIGFLVSDCSAAIENMLLASHALNLGAVWCGIYSDERLIKLFNYVAQLPTHIIPIGLVVVGNKAEEKKTVNRYDEKKVHYNTY